MYRMHHARWLPALVLLAAACSRSPVEPPFLTVQHVAGVYGASGEFGALTFTTIASGETTDWLDAGASLILRLNIDGTTEGDLFLPGADEDGSDFEADLTGTWQLTDGIVTLDHAADTFLRDIALTPVGDTLEGDHTFASTRVQVTLQKQ
ncbi:MAG TPA: hypothetical protein VFZ24_12465 [Longimicrobiales bacterium]